jgi:hypothetical protein
MLFGLSASDSIGVAAAVLVCYGVLMAVALLARYLPARWASRVNPSVALREGRRRTPDSRTVQSRASMLSVA